MQVQNQTQKSAPGRPGRPVGSRNTPPIGMLDAEGLSKLLGYTPLTVRRHAAVKPWKLPPRMNIPGRLLWSIDVVDAWLAQRTPQLSTESPMTTAPAPSQGIGIDLSKAFAIASVPTKAPGRGRPRGSRSIIKASK